MQRKPILLLEINEVPWRVIDLARSDGRYPNVSEFFRRSQTYTTLSSDVGELSPWVTWPSFHRGQNNEEHRIFHLGQDVSTYQGTPIWRDYLDAGLNIGICGSLQSWPPIEPGAGGFYVPDTFAHDSRTIPERVMPLQAFNLAMVRRNGLVIRDELAIDMNPLSLMLGLLRNRIRPTTYAAIIGQLFGERLDANRRARRPIFQTMLFWDVFRSLFDPKSPPAFSTFFTNHVAGVMHRYWDHVFPEDFPERDPQAERPHLDTMHFALRVLDQLLAEAMSFQKANPDLILVFASSMGQSAVHRKEHQGFDFVQDNLKALLDALGFGPESYQERLAMVPQVAAEVSDATQRRRVRTALEAVRSASGVKLYEVLEEGTTLSVTLRTPTTDDRKAGHALLGDGGKERASFESMGIKIFDTDPGTGYHVPEGPMAVLQTGARASDLRTQMPATEAKSFLLELGGVHAGSAKHAAE